MKKEEGKKRGGKSQKRNACEVSGKELRKENGKGELTVKRKRLL